jgi:drug/metabolite transporter (DMT)-like permease
VSATSIPGGWRTQFVLLSATWGSSFLFIKVLDRHWPAIWVALGRVALGALTLVVLLTVRRERLAFQRGAWRHLAVAALFLNVIPFTLFAYGEQHVSSIVAGLWNASAPLWVLVVVMLAFPEEHPTPARIAGLAVGFAGVVTLLGPWRGLGGGEAIGHLACAGAAVCYGVGFPYARRYVASRPESGVLLAAGQLLCASVLLAVLTPLFSGPTSHIGASGLVSILALGILGTGVAYVLNYAILRAAGATTASTVTYVVPVFSTLLGAIVLGEAVHWNQPAGAVVLLVGVAISQGRLRLRLARKRSESVMSHR